MIAAGYDDSFEPPAPVLLVGVLAPQSTRSVMVPMLVDSGADASVLPRAVVAALALPTVGWAEVEGIAGRVDRARVVAMDLRIDRVTLPVRAVVLEHDAILGRDVLASLRTTLDGPRRRLRVVVARGR